MSELIRAVKSKPRRWDTSKIDEAVCEVYGVSPASLGLWCILCFSRPTASLGLLRILRISRPTPCYTVADRDFSILYLL